MAYTENALVDTGLSRRLPFRPRANTGGSRLSKVLDGYIAANPCPKNLIKQKVIQMWRCQNSYNFIRPKV